MSYQVVTPAELLELAQKAFDEVALTESDQIAAQEPIAAFSVCLSLPPKLLPLCYWLQPFRQNYAFSGDPF